MRSIRLLFVLTAGFLVFAAASSPPVLAAGAVTSPSSRTVGKPANAVKLSGYVETAGQTINITAIDQDTGQVVTLGVATAESSGTSHTTPSGKHYTTYRWSFDAGVLAAHYWAPQQAVADVATSQGHLELIATAGEETLRTFSAAARASALASHDDPQTAAAKYTDGTSTVLFDTNGVGSGAPSSWVQVQGMISNSHSPLYSPVAWSVGTYAVENGLKIYALVCSPTEGGPYPTVIYNHGGTGSSDGGNLNGLLTASGWTAQPFVVAANGQPVPLPDNLGQCLDWAKRGWVFATSAYRGESVLITSKDSEFPAPAAPWASDGNVEFCMGEVTDVMALTDLLVNHADTVTLGTTAEKVRISPNGDLLMYGYSHGGCITYRAVAQGAPVKGFSVIEGFTDLSLNYLNGLQHNIASGTQNPAALAAIDAGAFQPNVPTSIYLPYDANHVMGYDWRSEHYFASRGDLAIQRFRTMPIVIFHGDVDTQAPLAPNVLNPVLLDEPVEMSGDLGTRNIFVGPSNLAPVAEPCIAGTIGAPLPSSITGPNSSCPISFEVMDSGDPCVAGTSVPALMQRCAVLPILLSASNQPEPLHNLIVYHNMNHTNGGQAIKETFNRFVELYFRRQPGCDGLEFDCNSD